MADGHGVVPATIHVRGLRLDTTLGVTPAERHAPRAVVIDLALHVDIGAAAMSDRIEDTVDYTAVRDRVAAVVASRAYHLLESLLEAIVGAIVADHRVMRARVRVTKPGAMRQADATCVERHWRRSRQRSAAGDNADGTHGGRPTL